MCVMQCDRGGQAAAGWGGAGRGGAAEAVAVVVIRAALRVPTTSWLHVRPAAVHCGHSSEMMDEALEHDAVSGGLLRVVGTL